MKLRHQILLWLLLTSLVPLLVLMLAVMGYAERAVTRDIDREMMNELSRLAAQIEQQFNYQRSMLDSLAKAPPLARFAAARASVDPVSDDQDRPDWTLRRTRRALLSFVVGLQPLIGEDAELWLLDADGRTLLGVRYGPVAPPLVRVAGDEDGRAPDLADWLPRLRALPDGEVSHLPLPAELRKRLPPSNLWPAVRPVTLSGQRYYLLYLSSGGRLDLLLELAARPRHAALEVARLAPGAVLPEPLYDDRLRLRFSMPGPHEVDPARTPWRQARQLADEGSFDSRDPDLRNYFITYTPYAGPPDTPDERWLLAAHVPRDALVAQFRTLRWGIAGVALSVVLLSLALAHLGARRLADPIVRLTHNLRAYARGEPLQPALPTTSREVADLQAAFQQLVTDLEQAEADKAAAEQRLVHSAALASVGEMAAGIGHELNNPLNNILALGKLLQRQLGDADSPLRADLDAMLDEARRASRIVRGVLNFARQIPPDYQPVAVCAWLDGAVQRVARLASERRVTIALDCPAGLSLEGDPFQLEQVVVNLLRNAVQASPAGGRVTLQARPAGPMIEITVTDQGEGLSPEAEAHLFEPFFTTKPTGEGTGLGLSVSLGIVQMHGGELSLQNHPAGGVVARLRLPRQRPESP